MIYLSNSNKFIWVRKFILSYVFLSNKTDLKIILKNNSIKFCIIL